MKLRVKSADLIGIINLDDCLTEETIMNSRQPRTTDPMVVHLTKLVRPTTFSETNTEETSQLITCGTPNFLITTTSAFYCKSNRHISLQLIANNSSSY